MKLIPNSVSRTFYKNLLRVKRNSPHIFFVAGVAGTVTSTVLACKATLKLSSTLDKINQNVESLEAIKQVEVVTGEPDTTESWKRDAVYVYAKSGFMLVKLYAPAATVGVISIGLLTGSHVQLSRRNTALMAAYSALNRTFMDYRSRVREKLGEEEEADLYHAVNKTEIGVDSQGNKFVEKFVDPTQISQYAKIFDEGSAKWNDNSEFNRLFLQCQLNHVNALLKARGHVFLNEVYDLLDVGRTKAGSVVGWMMFNGGDNYIDFAIFRIHNANFVNGFEKSIILDFNVDGVIYDKIKEEE